MISITTSCGAGAWLINMALDYPVSVFVGIDIAPLFPEDHPPNMAFIKCNILDGLPFPDNSFYFVRQAYVIICMNWQSWKEKVVKELIRVTKPGGYIEIMDVYRESTNPGIIGGKIDAYCKYLINRMQMYAFLCGIPCLVSLTLPLCKIVVFETLRKAGINPASGTDVIEMFKEFKDKVTVAPIEVRTYNLGRKAGRIGEAVSIAKTNSMIFRKSPHNELLTLCR